MRHIIRQTIRGCKTLPHVGEHPGTVTLILFLVFGGLATKPSVLGIFGTALFLLPLYLHGAYGRAELSDRLEREENDTTSL